MLTVREAIKVNKLVLELQGTERTQFDFLNRHNGLGGGSAVIRSERNIVNQRFIVK